MKINLFLLFLGAPFFCIADYFDNDHSFAKQLYISELCQMDLNNQIYDFNQQFLSTNLSNQSVAVFSFNQIAKENEQFNFTSIMQSIFVDELGRFREDSDLDGYLTKHDKVIEFVDKSNGEFKRVDSDEIMARENLKTLWDVKTNLSMIQSILYTAPSDSEILYKDESYLNYMHKYSARPNINFTLFNDASIKAFNIGLVDTDKQGVHVKKDESYELGEQVWQLDAIQKHLTQTEKMQQELINSSILIEDMKVFVDSVIYPNGWGTVLLNSKSYLLKNASNEYVRQSKIAVFDITQVDNSSKAINEILVESPNILVGEPILVNQQIIFATVDQNSSLLSLNHFSFNDQKVTTFESNIRLKEVVGITALDLNLDNVQDVLYLSVNDLQEEFLKGKIIRYDLKQNNFSTLIQFNNPLSSASTVKKSKNNEVWIFQGSGKYNSIQDLHHVSDGSVEFQNVLVGIKDHDIEIDLKDLFDSSDIQILASGQVYNQFDQLIVDKELDEIENIHQLKKALQSYPGWKINLQHQSGKVSEVVVNSPLIDGEMLVTDRFLPSTDLCHQKGSTSISLLDYQLGVNHSFQFVNQSPVLVSADNQLVTNEEAVINTKTEISHNPSTGLALYYTQEGTEVMSNTNHGGINSSLIQYDESSIKTLDWFQLY